MRFTLSRLILATENRTGLWEMFCGDYKQSETVGNVACNSSDSCINLAYLSLLRACLFKVPEGHALRATEDCVLSGAFACPSSPNPTTQPDTKDQDLKFWLLCGSMVGRFSCNLL